MSTVQEIKDAIEKLSPQELEEVQAWIEDQYLQVYSPVESESFGGPLTGEL